MCGLAHYFESEGFSTVLVGFVREHIEAINPPRALWLDFPMGRPFGKPNDPAYQTKVIREAFNLLDSRTDPTLENFSESIPVKNGRLSYALPVELILAKEDIVDVESLLKEVQAEIEELDQNYGKSLSVRGRTTVGASGIEINGFSPLITAFVRGDTPDSPVKGIAPVPMLKLVVEDLVAYYTETRTHMTGVDDFEQVGKWFWEETKAGRLILSLEAVALESENKVLREIVEMSVLTPRFWSEGPLPESGL